MNRRHKNALYTTQSTQDLREGWFALELHREIAGASQRVARVVFWDAEGQFALEATTCELPLTVVEDFLGEARATIKIQ